MVNILEITEIILTNSYKTKIYFFYLLLYERLFIGDKKDDPVHMATSYSTSYCTSFIWPWKDSSIDGGYG